MIFVKDMEMNNVYYSHFVKLSSGIMSMCDAKYWFYFDPVLIALTSEARQTCSI